MGGGDLLVHRFPFNILELLHNKKVVHVETTNYQVVKQNMQITVCDIIQKW